MDGDDEDRDIGNNPSQVETVKRNMESFTKRKIRDAATATRKFQDTAGLTTTGIISVVDRKMLLKPPITRKSINHSLSIWGPIVPSLDGENTRRKCDAVKLNEEIISPIPPHVLENHPVVILGMAVVKINGISFLATISRVIKLGLATELPNTKVLSIVSAQLVIVNTYTTRGFKILAIVADYAFEAIRQDEAFMKTSITINTTSEDEHEPFIEYFNRFLMEQCRMCVFNTSISKNTSTDDHRISVSTNILDRFLCAQGLYI